jgi:hypothetical protein
VFAGVWAVQGGGQILFTSVREQGYNETFIKFLGQLHSDMKGCAGAHSGKNALFSGQPLGHDKGIFVEDIFLKKL